MKWFVRSLVFAAALSLGITVGSIAQYRGGLSNCVVDMSDVDYDAPTAASRPVGISVMYAGLGYEPIDKSPFLKFVIHNGTHQRIFYGAKTPGNPYSELTANGRELRVILGCGTGIQTYYILPGDSAEVYVHPGLYLERPRKSERIIAGFYLRTEQIGTSEVYTSEPFLLPNEFREAIEPRDLSGL